VGVELMTVRLGDNDSTRDEGGTAPLREREMPVISTAPANSGRRPAAQHGTSLAEKHEQTTTE
jgi:hypothetical protein